MLIIILFIGIISVKAQQEKLRELFPHGCDASAIWDFDDRIYYSIKITNASLENK